MEIMRTNMIPGAEERFDCLRRDGQQNRMSARIDVNEASGFETREVVVHEFDTN